jgi:hypothetical protein
MVPKHNFIGPFKLFLFIGHSNNQTFNAKTVTLNHDVVCIQKRFSRHASIFGLSEIQHSEPTLNNDPFMELIFRLYLDAVTFILM